MSFSYDRSTDVGYTRFLVGDVDGSKVLPEFNLRSYLLDDEDIAMALSRSAGDCYLAAHRLCLVLASENLVQARAVDLGQFKTKHDAETHWEKLADQWLTEATLEAQPVDSVVAWSPHDWGQLLLYKALRGVMP